MGGAPVLRMFSLTVLMTMWPCGSTSLFPCRTAVMGEYVRSPFQTCGRLPLLWPRYYTPAVAKHVPMQQFSIRVPMQQFFILTCLLKLACRTWMH